VFQQRPTELLSRAPRVSVIVCTYNGGRTLAQCLGSLRAVDYPDYEVIVVDDGSEDDTSTILERFPEVRVIRQQNLGLSVARNQGLRSATGEIIAYTDSDCFAETSWLTHLVHQLERSGAAAVGGPNLTPEDGWLAPGQPTHVLESDQVAEHIPGCNMAFRRSALDAVNGFDPQYRTAGDDVDVCWRLQQAGHWITFAPAACVWHHRRATPRAYLRQQAGYGDAEALLRFKHPDKFNGRGEGKWHGVLYGASRRRLCLGGAIIYRGTFGTGLFQCLYQPAPAHWIQLPSTLEWHLATALSALLGLAWRPAWICALLFFVASLSVAAFQAAQANLLPSHDSLRSRLLIMALCYLQPLVRSWHRYRTRFFSYRRPAANVTFPTSASAALPWTGAYAVDYWSEDGCQRTQLLGRIMAFLNNHGWGKILDSGWSDGDLEIYCHPWTVVEVCTVQEEHGQGKRLIRVRYRLRASGYTRAMALAAGISALAAIPFSTGVSATVALAILLGCLRVWWLGRFLASHLLGAVDAVAQQLHLIRCPPTGVDATPFRSDHGN
jgi:GT2 family glycosyltransferase